MHIFQKFWVAENDDDKKYDENKPNKKSSNKKLTPKNKSVQFTNVNDTDKVLAIW